MSRLTPEQRLQIVEIYFQNQCSIKNVFRALREFYGAHNRPSETTIKNVITKFRSTFTLLDAKPPPRMRRVRTEEIIAIVEASVEENDNLSIRRRAQQIGLCPSTLWKILRKDLPEEMPASRGVKRSASISSTTSTTVSELNNKKKRGGEVFGSGMGSEGQLGTGNTNDAKKSTPVVLALGDCTPIQIAAGVRHTVLLAEDPTASKEESPAPEMEDEEEKVGENDDEDSQEDEKNRGRTKNQRSRNKTKRSDPLCLKTSQRS